MSEGKTFKIVGSDISDGYHTFDELYEHRCLLFLNWCLMCHSACVWKKDYEAWFCLYLELSGIGQISYHIPDKYLYLVEGKIRRDDNHKWDGHTSEDVIKRQIKIASGFGELPIEHTASTRLEKNETLSP